MAAKKKQENDEKWQARVEEIRADARSGINWAREHGYGPACTCGLPEHPRSLPYCPRHPEESP